MWTSLERLYVSVFANTLFELSTDTVSIFNEQSAKELQMCGGYFGQPSKLDFWPAGLCVCAPNHMMDNKIERSSWLGMDIVWARIASTYSKEVSQSSWWTHHYLMDLAPSDCRRTDCRLVSPFVVDYLSLSQETETDSLSFAWWPVLFSFI